MIAELPDRSEAAAAAAGEKPDSRETAINVRAQASGSRFRLCMFIEPRPLREISQPSERTSVFNPCDNHANNRRG